MPLAHDHDDEEEERQKLEEQTRIEKKIPVVVTLNADRLNSLETGIGYGTDTGARIRSQYRRAIVNKYTMHLMPILSFHKFVNQSMVVIAFHINIHSTITST